MITAASAIHRAAEYVPIDAPPATGHESPAAARDAGWLGQVPPPSQPQSSCPAPPSEPAYANPHLAPEPWKSDPLLPGTDPTLFG